MSAEFREAVEADIQTVVEMLADDPLGSKREKYTTHLRQSYLDAFAALTADPNNKLFIAQTGQEIAGIFQFTLIPYLTYQGRWRALIEGVRINKKYRGQGLGKLMIQYSIECARQRGCHLVQLTTDKKRPDAIAFYKSLGFSASHEEMKLHFE